MRINHNIQALNAYRNLNNTTNATSKSLEKLSSGMRINRASDDAAGLAISEKMRSQIRGLEMAERNSLDAISLIQTAEGGLSSTHEILQRMRELAVQAGNGTLEEEDRQAVQDEINQLTTEIDRIADTTQFNKKILFSGKKESFVTGNFDAIAANSVKTLATGEVFELTFKEVPKSGDTLSIGNPATTYTFTDTPASPVGATEIDLTTEDTPEKVVAALAAKAGLTAVAEDSGNGILTITAPSDNYEVSITDQDFNSDIRSLPVSFQIGANEDENVIVELNRLDAETLGIAEEVDPVTRNATKVISIMTAEGAENAITIFDNAIMKVSRERSKLGAMQNRLEHTITNLQTANENLTASESRIRDLDMAKEMTNFTRNNILNQAGQAMLAQANQLPQGVLQLLQ